MAKKLFVLFSFLVFIANSLLFAQGNSTVVLNLKNGYSVKGVIVEQTEKFVKIKTSGGEIFEYKTDEIININNIKNTNSSSSSVSLPQMFKTGDMVANLGFGFGWYAYGYGTTSLPAISLSVEKGIMDLENIGPLSVGGIIGFKHATYDWTASYPWTWNDIIIAARGTIHYDLFKVNKLDTYGGVALGVRIESESYYGYAQVYPYPIKKFSSSTTHPLLALLVGGRYYFSDKLAGYGELGYGLGYLTLGLSYKFN